MKKEKGKKGEGEGEAREEGEEEGEEEEEGKGEEGDKWDKEPFHERLSKFFIWLKIEIFIACVCLKITENGSLCCVILSFYKIFLSKSLLKNVT